MLTSMFRHRQVSLANNFILPTPKWTERKSVRTALPLFCGIKMQPFRAKYSPQLMEVYPCDYKSQETCACHMEPSLDSE